MVHLQKNGWKVEDIAEVDHGKLGRIRAQSGVPAEAASCHTAFVGRFVIEGHVPSSVIERLVREDPPEVAGLVVPGMPPGSPGMEGPRSRPYTVLALGMDGTLTEYEQVR